jgi:hypothetical protein
VSHWALLLLLLLLLLQVSCMPGGTASNIVAYIAKGDMPLSIMMTTASTLMAVFTTPLLTSLLVGTLVPVDPQVRDPQGPGPGLGQAHDQQQQCDAKALGAAIGGFCSLTEGHGQKLVGVSSRGCQLAE